MASKSAEKGTATKAPASVRTIDFPLISGTSALALASSSSLSAGAYAAGQSPMHDSGYCSAQAMPKRALGRNKGKIDCVEASKSNMPTDVPLVSTTADETANKAPLKRLAGAAYALFRSKKSIAKPMLKARLEGITRRFKENIALRRARHVIMSQKLIAIQPRNKPRLAVEALTRKSIAIARTAMATARTAKEKKAARKFLSDVEKELTMAFSPYDLRLRAFYAEMKSV